MITPDTPGYIAPDRHYTHVPNYTRIPAPKHRYKAPKVFVDVRDGRQTVLTDIYMDIPVRIDR